MTPVSHPQSAGGGMHGTFDSPYSTRTSTAASSALYNYNSANGYNNGTMGRRKTTLGRAPTRRMAPGASRSQGMARRGTTLIIKERYQEPAPLLTSKTSANRSWFDPWVLLSRIVTFWAVKPVLRAVGKHDMSMQQAWREKITLCVLIACLGGFVAFITIGLSSVMCPPDQSNNQQMFADFNDTINAADLVGVMGWQFNVTKSDVEQGVNLYTLAEVPGTDVTNYFTHGANLPACQNTGNPVSSKFAAVTLDPCSSKNSTSGCVLGSMTASTYKKLHIVNSTRLVGFDWEQLAASDLANYFVVDGTVLNMNPYIQAFPTPIPGDTLDGVIRSVLNQTYALGGRDATMMFFRQPELLASMNCLVQKYRAGYIDKSTAGCFTASIILYCSLFVVLSIVLARFFMALIFSWFLSRELSRTPDEDVDSVKPTIEMNKQQFQPTPAVRVDSAATLTQSNASTLQQPVGSSLYTAMLITCYSENTEGIRDTVESLSITDYPDDRKMLFLVADGMITGSGETMSTPDMCLSLVTFDDPAMKNAEPMSYVAVASGSKKHNCAKVYAGHYVCKGHKVPMILVVKCGNPEEEGKPKAGNRGKRDSQLILMNFFSRVTYNDRMTALDYELFQKIRYLMGVTPDMFELVLMVDADTKVYPSSLRLLVNCMVNDDLIMGLCGETKIANKRDSWVTAIQVYEYFISHHLAKGFESVFGGVTCLPGCFCMYRLKVRKDDDDWVPIITKPEIVAEYSQSTVDTLHQKNLLLLGEDRFLTTLMLRTFPHRKMVFTPQAICKTIVPDDFKVLLSQRRRWINSTIHNLFELVLVRNLCGTFCFSMQFVIMMDLIGTLTLPIAIVLTIVLIAHMAATQITNFTMAVPLVLLIIVLFSPAFLILITTRKWVYLMWMGIYLCALPIWNFVLPVYAFWHFDDFSWGETRKVTGEVKGDDHGKKEEAEFEPSKVPMKRWAEFERKRIQALKRRERKRQVLGPIHTPDTLNSLDDSGAYVGDSDTRGLLQADAHISRTPSPLSKLGQPNQEHYFNPVGETRGRATSGYYPTYRPLSQTPPPVLSKNPLYNDSIISSGWATVGPQGTSSNRYMMQHSTPSPAQPQRTYSPASNPGY